MQAEERSFPEVFDIPADIIMIKLRFPAPPGEIYDYNYTVFLQLDTFILVLNFYKKKYRVKNSCTFAE